jgi:hypothetical protein
MAFTMLHPTGHDSLTQQRIHQLLSQVIDELSCKYFQVLDTDPYPLGPPTYIGLLAQSHAADYPMICHEFSSIWQRMWYNGFALYDFKLYLQPTGLITITELGNTAFRMTAGPNLFSFPIPFEHEQYIFEHPCFPQNFLQNLLGPTASEVSLKALSQYPYREKSETRNPA